MASSDLSLLDRAREIVMAYTFHNIPPDPNEVTVERFDGKYCECCGSCLKKPHIVVHFIKEYVDVTLYEV